MMKNYFDKFYEVLHKNSIKRRRMVSLLLVLSMFVSSSVVWGLRGTVFTLVNEEEPADTQELNETDTEKLAYHVHTDECYQDVLICELEEDEEHTHTDECYEKQLICGFDEEDTTPDELVPDEDDAEEDEAEAAEDPDAEEADTEEDAEKTEESEDEEEVVLDAQLPDMMLAAGPQALDGESQTISTVDNIAEGIKFTLFDYGNADLEASQNNYNSPKAVGINTGRSKDTDIMFFAYGTAPERGAPVLDGNGQQVYLTNSNGEYIDRDGNVVSEPQEGEEDKRVPLYYPNEVHDRNNYSGDYNVDSYQSGNRPVQGIVSNTLTNGYPTINLNGSAGNSLDYLFSPSTTENDAAYKTVYKDVNHLLYKTPATGDHLVFNSNDHYAYYNQDTHDFSVYQDTFDIVNDNHHNATDINPKTEEEYGTTVDPGFKIGFFPFDQYDTNKKDPNFNTAGETYNHHFGMTMEARFDNISPDNTDGDPVIFKYSGDDDMWVFVDGTLVLDLGGIHEPTGGMIDFTNGLVWVQDNAKGHTIGEIKADSTLNYGVNISQKMEPTIIGTNTASTSNGEENKWILKRITDYLPSWTDPAEQYKKHDINMFYLERGGCYSNLAMEMNLPTLKPLVLSKSVDYGSHMDNEYDNKSYQFNIYEWDKDNNNWVIADFNNPDYASPVTLHDGEVLTIPEVNSTRMFKVVEVGLDPNVYSDPTIDINTSSPTHLTGNDSNEARAIKDANRYDFTNKIREQEEPKTVTKKWDLDNETSFAAQFPNGYKIKFKVYRKDLKDNVEEPVVFEKADGRKFLTWVLNCQNENDISQALGQLPTRYGDHYYTYRVEEMNVPKGYNASYGYDGNEMTITNKDASEVKISAEKKWENVPTGQEPTIKLQLKRKKASYSSSSAAGMTVRMVDMAGNQLAEYQILKTDEKVYEGGNAEFILSMPDGTEFYDATVESGNAGSKAEHYGGVLDVSNIKDGMTVVVKVDNSKAKDSLMLIHSSFSGYENNSTDSWVAHGGGVELQTVEDSTAIKNGSLLVSNRDKSWKGAKLYLSPSQFKPGQAYSFSVRVKVANPGESASFKVSFNDGLEKGNDSYHELTGGTTVDSNGWETISKTVTLPSELNPYGMFLLVETNGGDNSTTSFYIDEVVAVKGTANINVNPDNGQVTVYPNDGSVYKTRTTIVNDVYKDKNADNWAQDWVTHSNVTFEPKKWEKQYYLEVTPTKTGWDGAIQKTNLSLEPGKCYTFGLGVAGMNNPKGNSVDHPDLKLTLCYTKNGTKYKEVIRTNNSINGWEYKKFNSKIVKIPEGATDIGLYLEPQGQAKPYKVYDFSINEVTLFDDYNISYDDNYFLASYQSNLNAYGIELDEESATNPLNLGEYDDDTDFNNRTDYIVTLTKDDGKNWKNTWNNPTEDKEHCKYLYYVEEIGIGNEPNQHQIVPHTEDGNTYYMSDDEQYLVTYRNEYVATNDESNPITITNKYIWYKLPATGGIGTDKIYLLSIMLITIGITSGCFIYSRKRRLDENS